MKAQNLQKAIIIVILIGLFQALGAQELIRNNPADRSDPKTLLRNPAIIPFQNLAVNFGMRILNYGFLADDPAGIRYTYNTTSYPDLLGTGIAIGFLAQTFNAVLYSQSEFGLAAAYSIGEAVSVGVTTRFRNHTFDQSKMDLVNPNDPIFANGTGQWNASFDAGLVISPMEELSIGVSVCNLNKPDLSLANAGARLPREFSFGGKYLYRNFGFSLFGNYYNEKIAIGLMTEANIKNRFIFRAGYLGGDDCITAETQINMFKGLGLTYRFDYPLNEMNSFGSGTHQLELTWNMRYNPLYAYDIQASCDTVVVVAETPIIRISKNAITDSILKIIEPKDLLFSDQLNEKLYVPVKDGGLPLDALEEDTSFYKTAAIFKHNFDDIKDYTERTGKRIPVRITYNDAVTGERAVLLRKFFIDSLKIPPEDIQFAMEKPLDQLDSLDAARMDSIKELISMADTAFAVDGYIEISGPTIEKMEPSSIIFQISGIRRRNVSKWRIMITDFLGRKVHEIAGYHSVEPEVPWDGFTADGHLLRTGDFFYQFQYSLGGKRWVPKKPKRHRIAFRMIKRSHIIEIKREQIKKFGLLKSIVIILKNPLEVEKRLNQ
ncbi:MAG: type IX secretion system membrane protein PorP/SprF [Calditrichaeota bacterium]|nr:type IX secretion system membrane protein PorP/SprF [Calditrichota bacterium]